MCCEHLICAACAGPVTEARCPVCRAGRARVHASGTFPAVPPEWLAALAVALVTLTLLVAAYAR